MKKNLQKSAIFLARKAMHIYKSTILFLPILGYFCLFLPICESVANLHESTLLFAPNIHIYFAYFLLFDLWLLGLSYISRNWSRYKHQALRSKRWTGEKGAFWLF